MISARWTSASFQEEAVPKRVARGMGGGLFGKREILVWERVKSSTHVYKSCSICETNRLFLRLIVICLFTEHTLSTDLHSCRCESGRSERTRTFGLVVPNHALYQLSYAPINECERKELATPTRRVLFMDTQCNASHFPLFAAKAGNYTLCMLKEGDNAPVWDGSDQKNTQRSSSEFSGRWLLLYFYPKDDTPGCTIEACGFRDGYASLKDRIAIVGASADSAESHKAFTEKYQLPFTLVADPARTMLAAFGIGTDLPKRATFLIDPLGTIRKIYQGFDTATHATDVQKDLEAFGL